MSTQVSVKAAQACLTAAPAQTARLSTDAQAVAAQTPFDLSLCDSASFHVIWSGLTGTLDGTVTVEVSNDGVNWDTKNGASVTLNSAASNQMISLNGVVTEEFYRVRLTPGNISAGSVTVIGRGK